jgi:hypothetical protein
MSVSLSEVRTLILRPAGSKSCPIEARGDDSGPHRTVHFGAEDNLAARIKSANPIAIADASRLSIGWMHLEIAHSRLHLADGCNVGE